MAENAVTERSERGEGGFSMLELLVALTVLAVGITGILSLQMTSLRATAYSRHATEAAVLAEDRMEELRTVPISTLLSGAVLCPAGAPSGTPQPCTDTLDTEGNPDPDGIFTREWQAAQVGSTVEVRVTVRWNEHGAEPHLITMRTERSP